MDNQALQVSEKEVEESIVHEVYSKMGAKTTICVLVLSSGYEVVGSSAPIDAEKFEFSIGKKEARKKAVEKVWEYVASIKSYQYAMHLAREAQLRAAEEQKAASAPVMEEVPRDTQA